MPPARKPAAKPKAPSGKPAAKPKAAAAKPKAPAEKPAAKPKAAAAKPKAPAEKPAAKPKAAAAKAPATSSAAARRTATGKPAAEKKPAKAPAKPKIATPPKPAPVARRAAAKAQTAGTKPAARPRAAPAGAATKPGAATRTSAAAKPKAPAKPREPTSPALTPPAGAVPPAAAPVPPATAQENAPGATTASPEAVAKAYFAALAKRDVEAMVALWAPGGRENIRGQVDTVAPDGVREYFTGLFGAVPDANLEVLSSTVAGERAVVRWEMTGTFAGTAFGGIEATGARIRLEGMDELTITGGLIQQNNAFTDSMTFARQIGLLPAAGTPADTRILKAFNAKSRLAGKLEASGAEPVADGVWRVRGGLPKKTMNVYLVKDGSGVLAFDAGIRQMVRGIRTAAGPLGGLTRIVLGHSHADHRGAAAGLDVPVFCHEAERADAEGDGGDHYFTMKDLPIHGRLVFGKLLPYWDGGPVPVVETLEEGDAVAAGFEVVHLPGHAPGLIGLWRASDRVALTSDCFYTVDPLTAIYGAPRVPHKTFNQDTEVARASIRKVAELTPNAAWPGHAEALTGDVAGALEQAASST